jgi:hypothetical protein
MTQPLVKGFVNVRYWEAEEALRLLNASNIQAKLRPAYDPRANGRFLSGLCLSRPFAETARAIDSVVET